tara:strand:- start:4422 stop:4862 length:441 start_codon:yes stop_codon:yes gene_type:complete
MGKNVSALCVGLIFGFGLGLSQMVNPEKIIGFFNLSDAWDPSLAFVMIGALAISFISFRYIPKIKKPLFSNNFEIPEGKIINTKLILGAIIFGVGWGISGFCPGPAISSISYGYFDTIIFVGSMIMGALLGKIIINNFWKEKNIIP